ncbi:Alpha-glucan phosphorylase [Rubrobacter xylanophilus DSM 9941]|uniref:Alpha-glucan phosphorylase n=1 Tax=Rubrobacter xylanophilus (strain DSM 9941 / JCM 11954 / NBRC 16129 / PRD-1) TaxID=266117 RepID=Q1AZA1_RUBXD|nr:Alpha-glucan phosphorylase [Rubrobacter xylanophilus DSM 9941]
MVEPPRGARKELTPAALAVKCTLVSEEARIPKPLRRLPELAYNLLWSWRPEISDLFRRLDGELWEEGGHNPLLLLRRTRNLERAAGDPGFLGAYERALEVLERHLAAPRPGQMPGLVAYLSAEFGLHESLPIYSGGLGVLAGDHLKSASDLGVPMVGVGILYSEGYFRQRIGADGRQEEVYEPLDPAELPVRPLLDGEGREARVGVELPGRGLSLRVWRAEVGRVPLLLLDANVPENAPEDRGITARLYGGGPRTRIAQELVLGVGGVRALRAAGLSPAVFHMNEGHAAFSGLERVRELVRAGRGFEEARERVAATGVFTTHTPVPAGHDAFPPELFWEFMSGWPERLGTGREGLWALGRAGGEDGAFNMTALAMNLSAETNAVSALHRGVTERMWGRPVAHITNGVHTWSWLAPRMAALFDRHADRGWREAADDPAAWEFVRGIPAAELWAAHLEAKREALELVERLAGRRLDPEALTVGFARRFATYKRATLLLRDPERLRRIAGDPQRPVQFVFSGKAHPADEPGKALIRELHGAAEALGGRLVLLEDYGIGVARRLVQGVDVWLNNPRRPLEASGTSGQKAALNGVPNLSVLDGWWPEGYNGRNGWAVGEAREYASEEEQDAADAAALYGVLEGEVAPLYYRRGAGGVPEGWVGVMKEAIATVAPAFSAQRMVGEYVRRLYLPRLSGRG